MCINPEREWIVLYYIYIQKSPSSPTPLPHRYHSPLTPNPKKGLSSCGMNCMIWEIYKKKQKYGGRVVSLDANFGLLATRRRLGRPGDSSALRSAFVMWVVCFEGFTKKRKKRTKMHNTIYRARLGRAEGSAEGGSIYGPNRILQ